MFARRRKSLAFLEQLHVPRVDNRVRQLVMSYELVCCKLNDS